MRWQGAVVAVVLLAGCAKPSDSADAAAGDPMLNLFVVPGAATARPLDVEVWQAGAVKDRWQVVAGDGLRLSEANREVLVDAGTALVLVKEEGQPPQQLSVDPRECPSREAHVNIDPSGDGPVVLSTECTQVVQGSLERAYRVTVFTEADVEQDRHFVVMVRQGGAAVASREFEAMAGFPFRNILLSQSLEGGAASLEVQEPSSGLVVPETLHPEDCPSGEVVATITVKGSADPVISAACE